MPLLSDHFQQSWNLPCNATNGLKDVHFHIILKIGKCTKYSSTFPDFNVWINAATSHTILRSPWSTVGVHQCYFLNVATLLQIASFHFGFIKTRAAASDTSCLVDKYNVTNMINGWMEGVQNKADAVLFLLDRNVVMISLLKADNWRISHFEPHSDRVEKIHDSPSRPCWTRLFCSHSPRWAGSGALQFFSRISSFCLTQWPLSWTGSLLHCTWRGKRYTFTKVQNDTLSRQI